MFTRCEDWSATQAHQALRGAGGSAGWSQDAQVGAGLRLRRALAVGGLPHARMQCTCVHVQRACLSAHDALMRADALASMLHACARACVRRCTNPIRACRLQYRVGDACNLCVRACMRARSVDVCVCRAGVSAAESESSRACSRAAAVAAAIGATECGAAGSGVRSMPLLHGRKLGRRRRRKEGENS